MSRVIFSANQCSPVEQRLLKSLRAFGWTGNWPENAVFFLEEIGVDLAQAETFLSLVETIFHVHPEFEFFGPTSPFISVDELNLLALLAQASRKTKGDDSGVSARFPVVLDSLIEACGRFLHKADVVLKSRAILPSGRSLTNAVSRASAKKADPARRTVVVVEVQQLTTRTRRIIVSGDALEFFPDESDAQWVRLLLPGPNDQQVERSCTVRYFDRVKKQLALDFTLHYAGVMSGWAQSVKPGDSLQLIGPGGGFKGVTPRSWLLLAGDETGLPSIAAILEGLPAHTQVHAFLEVADEREKQVFEVPSSFRIRWIYRDGSKRQEAESLSEVLKYSPLPVSGGDAWIVGEASSVRSIRTQLLRDRGFELARVHAASYWKRGEENYSDI